MALLWSLVLSNIFAPASIPNNLQTVVCGNVIYKSIDAPENIDTGKTSL